MKGSCYYDSVIYEPRTILGRRLLPFSLGHKIILKWLKSPFFSDSQCDWDDLFIAVWVCSHTFEDNIKYFDSPKFLKKLKFWAFRCLLLNIIFKRNPPFKFHKKLDEFIEYLDEAHDGPEYVTTNPGCDELDICEELYIKVMLQKSLYLNDNEIYNRPYKLCLWELAALNAINGYIKIIDKHELEEIKMAAINKLKKIRN